MKYRRLPPSLFGQLRAGVIVIAAAFWLTPAHGQNAPAPASAVFVPSFWDPRHKFEKPELGTIRSIRFVTEDDYPPFHFALPDGTLAGFNIELGRAICDELKVSCTIQARRWDTIIEAIASGQDDAAIASVAITPLARRKLDFTEPYYMTPARFATVKSSPLTDADPRSLAGKLIGVEAGTAHEAFLRTFFPELRVRSFDNVDSLRSSLRRGDIDALFGDGITLALWLNGTDAGGCCEFRGGPYTEASYFGDGVGIAIRKDNPALKHALNYALHRLAERGIYADLYLKYFPVGFY
jgi:polar amino acid transport system substrate-binding protein